ncbi:MAG TPA: sensor domain-containing diguanylate cyclase [Waterburya sp.]|jgi:diguanylate cyclase (GGDEF)-like protein
MQTNLEIHLLEQLIDVLQACFSVEEADTSLTPLMQQLFPKEVGAIYIASSSKNLVEAIATWGVQPLTSDPIFTCTECVALQRRQAHLVEDTYHGLHCQHFRPNSLAVETLCVPMMAHGEIVGVLYIGSLYRGRITQIKPLAETVAKHISLALANLKRRDTLNYLRRRDPLTKLYNRHYLEEYLEREIQQSERHILPLGIILVHVEHLEHFNDRLGHAAENHLLREMGMFLPSQIRASDIACRYRGDEFLILLPRTSLEITQQQAEQLRQSMKQLNSEYKEQAIRSISISCGIANFSEHKLTAKVVLRAVNSALSSTKEQGCDRVVMLSY